MLIPAGYIVQWKTGKRNKEMIIYDCGKGEENVVPSNNAY